MLMFLYRCNYLLQVNACKYFSMYCTLLQDYNLHDVQHMVRIIFFLFFEVYHDQLDLVQIYCMYSFCVINYRRELKVMVAEKSYGL
jgi:hypothetical protein